MMGAKKIKLKSLLGNGITQTEVKTFFIETVKEFQHKVENCLGPEAIQKLGSKCCKHYLDMVFNAGSAPKVGALLKEWAQNPAIINDDLWRLTFYQESMEVCTNKVDRCFSKGLLARRLRDTQGMLGRQLQDKSLEKIARAMKKTFGYEVFTITVENDKGNAIYSIDYEPKKNLRKTRKFEIEK